MRNWMVYKFWIWYFDFLRPCTSFLENSCEFETYSYLKLKLANLQSPLAPYTGWVSEAAGRDGVCTHYACRVVLNYKFGYLNRYSEVYCYSWMVKVFLNCSKILWLVCRVAPTQTKVKVTFTHISEITQRPVCLA